VTATFGIEPGRALCDGHEYLRRAGNHCQGGGWPFEWTTDVPGGKTIAIFPTQTAPVLLPWPVAASAGRIVGFDDSLDCVSSRSWLALVTMSGEPWMPRVAPGT
jgi:hypothetical protein